MWSVRTTYIYLILQVSENKPGYPFVIEWIPEVLPMMQIGELRITLQYGHQKEGQVIEW